MKGGKQPNVGARPMPTQYAGVRRAGLKQDIDRRTWADLARAGFNLQVTGAGEYLTVEPIMFGQAYEEPPFFTWSGVGAGEAYPEVKAIGWPVGTDPCEVLSLVGDNVLPDPGFETAVGGGPSGTEFTNLGQLGGEFGYTLRYSNGSPASDTTWFTDQDFITHPTPCWSLSTASPRSGSKHLRATRNAGAYNSNTSPLFYAGGQEYCGTPVAIEPNAKYLVTKIATGTVLDWTFYARATTGTANVFASFDIFDAAGNYQSSPPSINTALTGSYAQYTVNYTIPAGGWTYARAWLMFITMSATFVGDADDCGFEVAA